MRRSRWAQVGVVCAVLAAGCGSGHSRIISEPATAVPSNPRLDAVLKDGGLDLSAVHIRAGRYLISFRDARSHPAAGDRVVLEFGASGPRFALVEVSAGTERVGTLVQNDVAWVTINGVTRSSAGDDSLQVDPTPQYPTPDT